MTGTFPDGTAEDRAIRAIILGRRAWTSAWQLSRVCGVKVRDRLESGGWIERWYIDSLGKPLNHRSWTLTPWGAEQYQVAIDEHPETEVPFWVGVGWESEQVIEESEAHAVALRHPERIPDSHSGPDGPRYLADFATGETTADPAAAVTLLDGYPVEIDPRLGSRKASATDRRRTRQQPGKPTPGRSTPKTVDRPRGPSTQKSHSTRSTKG